MRQLNTRLYATWRLLVWSVGATTFLAACSSNSLRSFFGPPDDEVADDRRTADETDVAVVPPPARVRAPGQTERVPSPATTEHNSPSPRAARPVVPAPVVSLAGLGEEEVLRALGQPQRRTETDGRKTWVYRGAGCRVEITFFRDAMRGVYSALAHKVVRTDTGAAVDSGTPCVRGPRSAARD